MFVAWVACPALLLAVCTGIGLGVRRLAGPALPGVLVPVCGLAVAMAAGGALAVLAFQLIVPALVALALVGAAIGRHTGLRPEPWALVVLLASFAFYAAPIVLSGEPTFAGYIKLDDTATWLAITDRVMDAGVDTTSLSLSSYEAVLSINFDNGYPVGGFVPLGVASEILNVDPAWMFQPYLAVIGGLLALALWELSRRAVASPAVRAVVAVTASTPALVVGYYLWGGLKEMLVATLVASLVACATAIPRGRSARRASVGVTALTLGMVGVAGVGVLPWALPALLLSGITIWRSTPRRSTVLTGLAALLAASAVAILGARLSPFRASFTDATDLGNLAGPLEPAQLLGIWPASDFRFDPGSEWLPYGMMGLVAAAAAAGAYAALRRRDTSLWVYPLGALTVWAIFALVASPWIEAKAYVIACPAVLLAALSALAAPPERWRRPALLGLMVVVAGVTWSSVTQWGGANLAPRDQLLELEALGGELAGRGPTLMTEYQPYAVRHFLRESDPEGASELRRRSIRLLNGGTVEKGKWVDTDDLDPSTLTPYEALVLRRSPEQSRPPGEFELAWAGDFYELWTRDPDTSPALMRLPLGDDRTPIAVPSCAEVRALASQAPGGGLLAARAPEAERTFPPRGGRWTASGDELEVWVKGSVRGAATLLLDGEPVATIRHALNNAGLYTSFGTVDPVRGRRHELRLDLGGADLHPGSAPDGTEPGRIVLRRPASDTTLRRVPASDARALCRAAWDWVEVRR